jgi:valyl-tRNA synthetase
MPFITEELWWRLRPRKDGEACIVSVWPASDASESDEQAAATFELMQEMATGIRNQRSQYNVSPAKDIAAVINMPAGVDGLVTAFQENARYFEKLARVTDLTVGTDQEKPKASASVVIRTYEVFLPLAGMVDLDQERERLSQAITQKEQFLISIQRKLQNEQFVKRAPADVVERERQKERDATAEIKRLQANLDDLEG